MLTLRGRRSAFTCRVRIFGLPVIHDLRRLPKETGLAAVYHQWLTLATNCGM